jgi:hypothetical protein
MLDANPNDDVDEYLIGNCGCGYCPYICCDDEGLCDSCGDVPGYSHEVCDTCIGIWVDRRYEEYFSRA